MVLLFFIANSYETEIINFMDILGIIGGLYEILYIFTSLFLRKIIDAFFRRNLIQKQNLKSKNGWFTYPSWVKGKKSNKIFQGDLESSNISGEEGKILDAEVVRRQISDSKYFIQNLDWMNLVQSIHELKLYVSYLLEKDNKVGYSHQFLYELK